MLERSGHITALGRSFSQIKLDFGRVRHHSIDKFAQLAFGQRALKLVDRLAVYKRKNGRNRLDPKVLGKLLLFVGVDLDKLESTAVGLFQFLEHRRQRLARAAPRRPKINQYRDLLRGFDDIGLERLDGGIGHGWIRGITGFKE